MQQGPANDAVTPSFLMDVFNQFISNTFEKDPKYDLFRKEWENFKEILVKDPLNLEQVFAYVAKLQLNLSQSQTVSQTPVTFTQEKPAVKNLNLNINGNTGPAHEPQLIKSNSTTNYQLYAPSSGLDTDVSPVLRTEVPFLSPRLANAKMEARTQMNVAPLLQKPGQFNLGSGLNLGSVGVKYQLGGLAEKAKGLKQNIQKHSDTLSAIQVVSKRSDSYKPEERSALRKIAIYAKQPNFKEIVRNLDEKVGKGKTGEHNQTIVFH